MSCAPVKVFLVGADADADAEAEAKSDSLRAATAAIGSQGTGGVSAIRRASPSC